MLKLQIVVDPGFSADDVAARNRSVSLLRFCGFGSLRPFLAKGGEEVDHRQLLESVLCHLEEEREKQLQELVQILDQMLLCFFFLGGGCWWNNFWMLVRHLKGLEYLAHYFTRTTSQVTLMPIDVSVVIWRLARRRGGGVHCTGLFL